MNPKARELSGRLNGALIPAMPVPFDVEGAYQHEAEKKLVEYHAYGPGAGVALWVHTGRGLRIQPRELERVYRNWRSGLRNDQYIICGVGCPEFDTQREMEDLPDADFIEHAVEMGSMAKNLGADGLLVYPPRKFRNRPDAAEMIIEYYESIASLDKPIILFYLYEAAGGVSFDMDLLRTLLAMPMVAGIKVATLDSVMTFQDIARLVKTIAPGVTLLSGEDRFLGYTIMRGAQGALVGMGCTMPGPQEELITAWRERRFERFVRLSNALDDFAEATFMQPMEGYIRRVMLSLMCEGVLPKEAAYDPWGPPVPNEQIKGVAVALNRLKEVYLGSSSSSSGA